MIESKLCFLCQQSYGVGIAISYRFVCALCMDSIRMSNVDEKNECKLLSIEEWRDVLELDTFSYQAFGIPCGGGGSGRIAQANDGLLNFVVPIKHGKELHIFFTHGKEMIQRKVSLNEEGEIDINSLQKFS